MNKYKQELIDYNIEHNLYPKIIETIMDELKKIITDKQKVGQFYIHHATQGEVVKCLEVMGAVDFLSEYEVRQGDGRVAVNVVLDIWD